MRLRYITPLTFPSKFVNRLQVMKMSAAFTKQADFALYIAKSGISHDQLFREYNVREPFSIKEVGEVIMPPRRFWQARKFLSVIKNEPPDTIWYVRDVLLADWICWFSRGFRKNYFFELHTVTRFSKERYQRVLGNARGVIVTGNSKEKDVRSLGIIDDKKAVLVADNGVDFSEFDALRHEKTSIRESLGLPQDKLLVVYAGTDAENYGTGVLRKAANMLIHEAEILIISGKPRNDALRYMAASDILAAPYLAANDHFKKYMSPMKVREYMAMERPIIISDLPATRFLPEDTAYFVPSGDATAFVSAVREIIKHKEEADKRAYRARKYAEMQGFSWDERARRIIDFIKTQTV